MASNNTGKKQTEDANDKEEQSKWLEEYLKKEHTPPDQLQEDKNIQNETNKIQSEIIYDEDEVGRETPECANDETVKFEEGLKKSNKDSSDSSNNENQSAKEISKQSEIRLKVSKTIDSAPSDPECNPPEFPQMSKQCSNSSSSKDDIPIVSYNDDSKSSTRSAPQSRLLDSDITTNTISDPNTPRGNTINSSSLLIPSLEPDSNKLQQEQYTDVITNDVFYDILAEVITNLVPKRDLAPFSTTPINFRNIIDANKRKKFDLLAIEKYLEQVIESIMENESGFIDNLLEPVRRNPVDMLQLLQNSDLGSYEHFENI